MSRPSRSRRRARCRQRARRRRSGSILRASPRSRRRGRARRSSESPHRWKGCESAASLHAPVLISAAWAGRRSRRRAAGRRERSRGRAGTASHEREGGRLRGVAGKRTQEPPCVCWRLSCLVRETSGFASPPRGEFALFSSGYPIGDSMALEPSIGKGNGRLFESGASAPLESPISRLARSPPARNARTFAQTLLVNAHS